MKAIKDLALLVTVNCVRNTCIEDYHARGSLTQDDMKAFNRQVASKIYTFLEYVFNRPTEDYQALLGFMGMYYPRDWDEPELSEGMIQAAVMWSEQFGTVSSVDGANADA